MFFASDNAGPAHPAVMEAVVAANAGYQMPYGADDHMAEATALVREVFEAPDAAVYLVATGTAANALVLGTFANPWDAVFCHRIAHVEEDECGAPEFFTNGAKLTPVEGGRGLMDPEALEAAIVATGDKGVHGVQRGPVTITQASEVGTVYALDHIRQISAVTRAHGLALHLDGARFANALVTLGATAAEMTWKAGVDAVSFGGTKNGCMGVEAVVFFDPAKAASFEFRRKRGAHLFSKHRYLSAQMAAYLRDGLWLDCARAANANMDRLVAGLAQVPGAVIPDAPEANMVFAHLPRAAHRRAMAAGAKYYLFPWDVSLEGPADSLIRCRLVCDWSKSPEEIDRLIDCFLGG